MSKGSDPRSQLGLKSIASFEVRDLFGYLHHRFSLEGVHEPSTHPLFILYGDNGTGKTTILNLIYHLLAQAEETGHRLAIANIPFRFARIDLTNGSFVSSSANPRN